MRSAALAVGLVLAVLVAVFATREAGQDRMTTHLVGAVAPRLLAARWTETIGTSTTSGVAGCWSTSSPPLASLAWRSTPSWWPSRGARRV
ncbi:MAG: hypothetical protein Ct9H300mP12_15470 [Acidimicrobiales bacterium]|nr:MAG: hypothetical protein Ct9H300mP12_15470 [Acidimicrobiales bacterium]